MSNMANAGAVRNISIQYSRPQLKASGKDYCRWCARPILESQIEALRFYCGPVCITSAAWFVASKQDFGTRAYRSAVGKTTRQKVTLPSIAMEAA